MRYGGGSPNPSVDHRPGGCRERQECARKLAGYAALDAPCNLLEFGLQMGLRGNGCVLALRHLPSISPVRLSEKKQPVSSELMLEATPYSACDPFSHESLPTLTIRDRDMTDIFISYSHGDRAKVKQLVDALTAEGWEIWWDPKIRAGTYIDEAIQDKLNQARCVLVVWSSSAVNSTWVRQEAAWATKDNKVVSIRIEDNLELPVNFCLVHTRPMVGWNGARGAAAFRELLTDIQAVIGSPARCKEPLPSLGV